MTLLKMMCCMPKMFNTNHFQFYKITYFVKAFIAPKKIVKFILC